jgi:flagellar hook-associated protein 2
LLPTAGPIKLSTGTTEQTLAVGPGNDSLMSVVQSLNGIPGLRAWLLQTRQGLALLVKSLPGTSNALQQASIETLWRLLQSALLSQSQPLIISFDEIPATDPLEGPAGLARDAGDGTAVDYRITAIPQTHAHLHPKETIAALQVRVAALIREVNALHTFLASIAKRGAGSGTDINLQDRIFAQVLLERLRKITTRPVYGFASNPIFPADIGLEVGEDGLLTFNEACFNRMSEYRQDLLAAMVGPNADPDDIVLSQDIKATDVLKQGVHTLIYDPTQTPVIATLDGFPLQRSHDPDGRPVFILGVQDQNLALLPKDSPMVTELVYRLSLFDQLAAIAATTLSPDAPNLQSGTAHDVVVASAKRDDASVGNMILAVLAQAVDQSDVAQPEERDAIPPQAAELLFYLLWIGLFVPKVDRDRRKKQHQHRRSTPHGASITFFGQALWDQISKAKNVS